MKNETKKEDVSDKEAMFGGIRVNGVLASLLFYKQ
jgi:hypothetical protein